MIVNIRGTSGSGKSTLVRRVMSVAGERVTLTKKHLTKEKDVVAGYEFPMSKLLVVGPYPNEAGGGCDNYSTPGVADWFVATIADGVSRGLNVVYEGQIAGKWSTERCVKLSRLSPMTVILLTTPLDVCLASIAERRAARGITEPLDQRQTQENFNYIVKKTKRDKLSGITTEKHDREEAYQRVLSLLGLGAGDAS